MKPCNLNKKKENKLLFLLLIILGVLLGLLASNFYMAYEFNFNQKLGNIYLPWKGLDWYFKFGDLYPSIFRNAFSIFIMIVAAIFIVLLMYKNIKVNSNKKYDTLHGSARWANENDIVNSGLLKKKKFFISNNENEKDGVYVGGWEDSKGNLKYLRSTGSEHVLTYAPTRSGKGVGLVVPTLLSWKESCLITDLKGELWALTSGWRKGEANNIVVKFEPASDKDSVYWNPLEEIRVGQKAETGDIQNLATLIVDPDGKGLEDHWQKTAQSLLTGTILYAILREEKKNQLERTKLKKELEEKVNEHEINLEKIKKRTNNHVANLTTVDQILADPNLSASQLWDEMIDFKKFTLDKDGFILCDENGSYICESVPLVNSTGRDMSDRPDEEAGSVLSTAKSYLSLYRDPIVAKNISKSTFQINDLMNLDKSVSLYIITEPVDKERLKPLVRIMVNMIFRKLAIKQEFEDGRPVATYKHKMLAMLDEFPSLGKLSVIQESLAFIASYGIKCYLICQDLNQLKSKDAYGPDETITSSCHIQNAYPPNRIETAEHISKLTGTTTAVKESITTSGKRTSVLLSGVSKTYQEVQRPLLTADEAMRLPAPIKDGDGMIEKGGDMIIWVTGFPAIYGKQILYFKDPVFNARSKMKAILKSDVIERT